MTSCMYSRISNHISALDSISRDARYRIEKAMTHWQRHTCVKFVPYDRLKHTNYVTIQKGQWCASKLGMTGGVQPLYLALGCLVRKLRFDALLLRKQCFWGIAMVFAISKNCKKKLWKICFCFDTPSLLSSLDDLNLMFFVFRWGLVGD